MDYKIVFLDIDGTLLNPDHEITTETKATIRWIVEDLGIPVVLATARPFYGAYFFRDQLGLGTPLVCFNGGLVMRHDGTPMVDHKVERERAAWVVEHVKAHGVNLLMLDQHHSYALERDHWVAMEEELTQMQAKILTFDHVVADWEARGVSGANKLMAVGTPEKVAKLESSLKSSENIGLTINISHPSYLEITHSLASKQQAVAYIHQSMGIRRDKVIAIGDSFNDIDMIRYAGLGIAMGNSHAEVQQSANWVTASNEQDGVAKALRAVFGEILD